MMKLLKITSIICAFFLFGDMSAAKTESQGAIAKQLKEEAAQILQDFLLNDVRNETEEIPPNFLLDAKMRLKNAIEFSPNTEKELLEIKVSESEINKAKNELKKKGNSKANDEQKKAAELLAKVQLKKLVEQLKKEKEEEAKKRR